MKEFAHMLMKDTVVICSPWIYSCVVDLSEDKGCGSHLGLKVGFSEIPRV